MKIITDQFCNLSRSKEFQNFLRSIAPDLYKKLIKHLQLGESCRSNRKKMIEIQNDLENRKLHGDLYAFLESKFPQSIAISSSEAPIEKHIVRKLTATSKNDLYNKMNYHEVFELYRPKVLTIPQRHIIVGPTKSYVKNKINLFVMNKLDIDYIILKGDELWHGYIEYFDMRFAPHIQNIQYNHRPIAQYRAKNNIYNA